MCLFPQETVNSKRTRTMTISCSLLYPQKMVLYTHTCIGTVYPLSSTISQSLLKLISIELVMLSNHLILCLPLLLLPSVFPSIGVFSILHYFSPISGTLRPKISVVHHNTSTVVLLLFGQLLIFI